MKKSAKTPVKGQAAPIRRLTNQNFSDTKTLNMCIIYLKVVQKFVTVASTVQLL
jgi:hypothetical protein